MKMRPASQLLIIAMACLPVTLLPQDNKAPDLKQIMASGGSWRNVTLTARSIERGASHPSVVQLKGDVQIKMKGLILRADEAAFHEGTGEIHARGNVRVIPYPTIDTPAPDKK